MGKDSRSSDTSESDQKSSSGSDSDSSSNSSSPGNTKDASPARSPASDGKKKRGEDIKQCWEENPDVYGIRRSGRSRKEPERLSATSPTSDSEARKPSNPRKDRKRSRKRSESSNSGDSSGSGSESSFEVPAAKGKRAAPQKNSKKSSSKSKKASKPPPRASKNVNLSETSDASSDDSNEETVTKSRAKTRRAAAKVNYREVSDDDEEGEESKESKKSSKKNGEQVDCQPGLRPPPPEEGGECVEKVMDRRIGRPTAVGASTTRYSIEKNGDPNEGFDPNCGHGEEQYLIKWKGWSHLHNTWESLRTLRDQNVRGMKKVENFIRREEEINVWRARANPEDIEYLECQRDLVQDLAETFVNVERVISSFEKPGSEQPDYLIKWENLSYSECTWEDGSLIEERWADKIDDFRTREDCRCVPNTSHRYLRSRPKFLPIKEQPEFLGEKNNLKLRDYQLTGLNWLVNSWCRNNSVILADEMGLGKTIQVICFLSYLFKTYQLYGPFLVVVPLSTMTAWQREFANWFPEMNVVVYIGDVASRNTIRAVEWLLPEGGKLKFNAVLTTYEILLKDKNLLLTIDWAVLCVDEAHRLKNDDSLLYRSLVDFKTNFRCLVTGTPLQNSLKELWALLHFIMPDKFEDWEEFDREHAAEKAKNLGYKGLHKQLEPYILRRVKKDVERSLPAKVEQILRVDMTTQQRQFYKWILTKNFEQLKKGNRGSLSTFTNIIVELKKCCNHAFLTKPVDEIVGLSALERIQRLIRGSGKLLLLDKLLVRLRETGHRVLIFSQMVRMLDILSEYLMLRQFPFQRLDGGIKGELRRQALDHFNADGSPDFCFLLSTRAGGLGINLATADTVIIFDSDWNPQNDLQAQSRAHRIGQKNQVNIYRLVTKASVEENIIERAKKKMILDHLVIQNMDTTGSAILDRKSANSSVPFNKEELTAILKFGAEELFKDGEEKDEEPACDIDDILRRAETRDEEPRMAGDELLSQFKVTSFVFDEEEERSLMVDKKVVEEDEETKDWSELIPEMYRKKVEDQEKEKEIADLYLPPRSRKTKLRSSNKKADDDESEEEDEEDDDEEDDSDEETGKKKRGRKAKELVKGFTTPEIRRFVKSWKKFPNPMSRLDSIAVDAELQEKSNNDLKRLGEMLITKCQEALEQQTGEEGGKKSRGPKIQLGGVSLNARTILSQMDELKPLESLPADKKERSKWLIDAKVKACHWDCDWTREDDSRLLQGIYEYGMGSWEAIKADPSLKLEKKILPEDGKPNEKQLQTRADYLIRAMAKNSPSVAAKVDHVSPRKGGRKPKTKAFIEEEVISSDEDKPPPSLSNSDLPHPPKKPKPVATATPQGEREGSNEHDDKKTKKEKEHKDHKDHKKHHHHHKNKKKKVEPPSVGPVPLHFTTHETVAMNVTEELSEETFKDCKEKMRPVKKSLKQLGNPDPSLSEKDQLAHTRQCLRLIGDHINTCLLAFHDPEKIREWRSNLWFFVSKFTEFDAPKLYKLYKKAKEKDDDTTKKPKKSTPGSTKPSPGQKRKAPDAGKAASRPTSTGPGPAKRPFTSSSSTMWNKKKREDEAPKPDAAKGNASKDNRRSMSPPEVDHVLPPVSVSSAPTPTSSSSSIANASAHSSHGSTPSLSGHHREHRREYDPDLEEGEMRDEDLDRDRFRDRERERDRDRDRERERDRERGPADYPPRRQMDDDPRWREYARYPQRHPDPRRDRDGYTDAYYRGGKPRAAAWPAGYAHMPMTVPHTAYYPQHNPPGPSTGFRAFPRDRRDPRAWDRDKKLGPP